MAARSTPAKRPRKSPPAPVDRVADLRADYDRLGQLLTYEIDGSKAAALARERRMIRDLLESLEAPKGVPVVDQLAARRRASPGVAGAASRRRKPG
jgi:hypothetical protein